MNILYGIQGTGHGHISRAREILPKLTELADIDVLVSGYNCKMTLDDRPIIHKRGLSLAYDSKGGVSYLQTALKIQPVTFLKDIHSIDLNRYDLIISDFEPVTAWASLNKDVPAIALSHQASFLSNHSPRPKHKSLFAEQILKNFAPCKHALGFHFLRYDSFILPPVIRKEVLELEVENGKHITVYLPAFHHETLFSLFSQLKNVDWHLFSPTCSEIIERENVIVHPVGNRPFLKSMRSGMGVITSAGFETCAESMYLGKKLLVIPIKNQYEQLCNAAALKEMGVHVVKRVNRDFVRHVQEWLDNSRAVTIKDIADIDSLAQNLLEYADNSSSSKKRVIKSTALT